jgi:hypothetical protein
MGAVTAMTAVVLITIFAESAPDALASPAVSPGAGPLKSPRTCRSPGMGSNSSWPNPRALPHFPSLRIIRVV